ncbi:hypothetical protein DMC30DRAFT_59085 [Rhodotorula diobovata]|uniref:Uncharacterized protein n=1 Tax=Rhodotorula diobovata TaxID=5288 RepID=A0A5C5FNF2_9BASI|nr:hypothetical protein DMC30DRAFT_59085 [Rhodotorula diobovata]
MGRGLGEGTSRDGEGSREDEGGTRGLRWARVGNSHGDAAGCRPTVPLTEGPRGRRYFSLAPVPWSRPPPRSAASFARAPVLPRPLLFLAGSLRCPLPSRERQSHCSFLPRTPRECSLRQPLSSSEDTSCEGVRCGALARVCRKGDRAAPLGSDLGSRGSGPLYGACQCALEPAGRTLLACRLASVPASSSTAGQCGEERGSPQLTVAKPCSSHSLASRSTQTSRRRTRTEEDGVEDRDPHTAKDDKPHTQQLEFLHLMALSKEGPVRRPF